MDGVAPRISNFVEEKSFMTKVYALRGDNWFVRYVGKTIRSLQSRLAGHLDGARKGNQTHKARWIRSMLNRGLIPTITLLGEYEGDGSKEEIAWIKYFRDHGIKLTNATDGGEGTINPTKETRAKLRRARLGKHQSEAAKKKVSLARRGKPLSEAHRRKIQASLMGHASWNKGLRWKQTEDAKKRMSEHHNSPGMAGKHHSVETKEKMRASALLFLQRQRQAV